VTAIVTLIDRIEAAATAHAGRTAVWARDESITYGELIGEAHRIASALLDAGVAPGDRVALLSQRSCAAYAAIVGILRAGCVYVPLGTRYPPARNRRMLELSGATALVIDDDAAERYAELLAEPPPALVTIVAIGRGAPPAAQRLVRIDRRDIATTQPRAPWPARPPDADCYLIFTSGSTGEPKGVPISHANIHAYRAAMSEVVPVTPDDRVIQLGDLTFDISIQALVMALGTGAALYDVPEHANLLATRFVRELELTVWLSVPSAIELARRADPLVPGSLPSLRASQIGGEALPGAIADAWAAAAPNSTIFNLYGPTEGTVVWSAHRIVPGAVDASAIVPIGRPLPGVRMDVFGPDDRPLPAGETGELWLAGPQLTRGYWNASEADAARFKIIDGTRWYRTGDLARWSDPDGFHYVGRIDQQAKILGFRVELLEIESALRAAARRDEVAVIAWPVIAGGALGTVAFVTGPALDADTVLAALRARLPHYMIPSRIIAVDAMPRNANGKTDYGALRAHRALAE
jgi:D-alanine--poly(phosphoribitol) ligase subunit 1